MREVSQILETILLFHDGGRYPIETIPVWFLYDIGLRHERANFNFSHFFKLYSKTAGFYILNVDENLDVALLCHFYCAILKTLHNFKVEELTTEQIGLFSFKMFKYSKFLKTT